MVKISPFYCASSFHTLLRRAEQSFCSLWIKSILLTNSYTCSLHSCLVSDFARLRYGFHKETSSVCIQIGTTQHMCMLAYRSLCLPVDNYIAQNHAYSYRHPAQHILSPPLQKTKGGRIYRHPTRAACS